MIPIPGLAAIQIVPMADLMEQSISFYKKKKKKRFTLGEKFNNYQKIYRC